MREYCVNHVNKCLLCKLRKVDKTQGLLPTKRYDISVRPCQHMHLDLMGPFKESDNGYIYIMVCKCPLTQWIEVVPLMTKSTLEVTEAFTNKVLSVHGSVEVIVTDNGKEFCGNIAGACHYLFGNTHKRVTAYRPQGRTCCLSILVRIIVIGIVSYH